MLIVRYASSFKKDFNRCEKRRYNMGLLQAAIDTLRVPAPLPPQNKDHNLSGNWAGYRECHLLSDWLLIYRVVGNELWLDRLGTHSDIFG